MAVFGMVPDSLRHFNRITNDIHAYVSNARCCGSRMNVYRLPD